MSQFPAWQLFHYAPQSIGRYKPDSTSRKSRMSKLVFMERLEDRQLLAAVPINLNLSRMRANQSEGAIAIDPTNPNNMFVVSNIDKGAGLFTARSSDGGVHWPKR